MNNPDLFERDLVAQIQQIAHACGGCEALARLLQRNRAAVQRWLSGEVRSMTFRDMRDLYLLTRHLQGVETEQQIYSPIVPALNVHA